MSNDGGNSELRYHRSTLNETQHIAERVWNCEETPRALLVALHGGSFHGAWFGQLGDALAARNVRVSCADFPSHGLSEDLVPNLRLYLPEFAKLSLEVHAAVARAREAVPDTQIPLFLMGESMGGLAAMQAVLDGVSVDGLILSGALLEFASALRPPAIARIVLHAIAFISPQTPIPIPIGGETFEQAFGDPECARKAREDPLVCDDAPPRAGFVAGVLAAQARVKREATKAQTKSVLFMHYEHDGRTDQAAARAVVESMTHVEDKVIRVIDGTSHQLFQDVPERISEHIGFVVDFICARSKGHDT